MKYKKQNSLLKRRINFNFFGLGRNIKKNCFNKIGINSRIKISNIKDKKISLITQKLKTIKNGMFLKKKIKEHINFFKNIKNIRGIRHKTFKPVRGQRTKTNAKTRRKKIIFSSKTSQKGSTKASNRNSSQARIF